MNCNYSLPCFCSDSNDLIRFSCLVCTWFQYLYIKSKDTVNCIRTPIKNFLTFASGYLVKFCNCYPHLSLETVLLALKLTQIWCCINVNMSFLENWKFNHKLAPLLLQTHQAWKTVFTIWQIMKVSKILKFHFSQVFT